MDNQDSSKVSSGENIIQPERVENPDPLSQLYDRKSRGENIPLPDWFNNGEDTKRRREWAAEYINLHPVYSGEVGNSSFSEEQSVPSENSAELEQTFNPDRLPSKIIIGLANKGIRIEVVDALMNLALYDEEENVLKVRHDADVEHVVGYVKSLGIVDEEAPESDLTDEEKDVDLKRSDSPDIDLSEVDTNELKDVVGDNLSTEDGPKSTVDISDEQKLPEEVKAPAPEEAPVPVSPDQNAPAVNIIGEQIASPTPTAAPSQVDNAPAPTAPVSAPVPPPPAPQDPNSAPAAAPAPAPSPAPAPAPVERVDAKSETWERMEKIRDDLIRFEIENKKDPVRHAFSARSGLNIAQLNSAYMDAMKGAGEEIINRLRQERIYGPLTKSDTQKLEEEINSEVLEKIFKAENQIRSQIKEQIEGPNTNKALEVLRKAAQSRIGQKYLSMNKWVRLGATTAVLTAAGYAAGTMAIGAAAGWGAARLARGAASIAAGTYIRGKAEEHWTDEKVEKKYENKKKDELNSKTLNFEEKYKKIKELERQENKEKGRQKIKKVGVTIAAGAGAGVLAGLSEGIASGKIWNILDQNIRGAKKFDPSPFLAPKDHTQEINNFNTQKVGQINEDLAKVKPGIDKEIANSNSDITNIRGAKSTTELEAIKAQQGNAGSSENYTDETGEHESIMRVTKAPEAVKSVFEKLEQADFVPEKGSTLWGGMGKVLENNERFAKLSPEAKHFIQSTYLNKAFNDPEHYGFEEDPDFKIRVDIGKKINFAELFRDKDEFEKLLTKAENLSDAQKLNIKTNDEAIANWVKAHPGEKATPEKIDEILNSKNNHATLEDDLIPKGDVPESSPHIEPGFEDETPAPEVAESYPDGGDTTPNLEEIESFKKSAAAIRDSFEKMNRDFESVKSQIDKSILESAAQKGGANPEIINSQIKAADALDVKAPQISGPWILEGLLKREAELAALFKETDDKLTKMIDEAIRNPGSVDDSKLEEMAKTLRNITNERSAVNQEIFNLMNKRPKIESAPDNFGNLAKGGAALTGATVVGKMFTDAQKGPAELQKEIEDAKRRYAELQNEGQADSKSKFGVIQGGRDLKTNLGAPRNMRSYSNDLEMMNEMRGALGDEINNIYTETNWLGRVKTPGVESADWGLIKRLPAYKVLEFRYKNSKESGLSEEVTKELSKNKRHQKMLKRLDEFMEYTGGTVRPRKEEPVETFEDFMLRLGMGIRKRHEEDSATNIKKAA